MRVRSLLGLALALGAAACDCRERRQSAPVAPPAVRVEPVAIDAGVPTALRGELQRGDTLKVTDAAPSIRFGAVTFRAEVGTELEAEERLRVRFGSVTVLEVADGGVADVQLAFGHVIGPSFTAEQGALGEGRVRATLGPVTFLASDGTHLAIPAGGALLFDGLRFEQVDLRPHVPVFGVAPATGLAAPEAKRVTAEQELSPTRPLALFADGQQRLAALRGARGRVAPPSLEGTTERWSVSLEDGALLVLGRYGYERRVDFADGPSLRLGGGLVRVERRSDGYSIEALVGSLSAQAQRDGATLTLRAGESAFAGATGFQPTGKAEEGLALSPGRHTVFAQEVTLAQWAGSGRLTLEVRGRRLVDTPTPGPGAAPLIPGDAFSFTWKAQRAEQRGTVAVQREGAAAPGLLRVPVRDEERTKLLKPEGQELQLQFRWGPDTRAESYRLELFRAEALQTPLASVPSKGTSADVSAPVGLGEYAWIALPLDAAGKPIAGGRMRRLTVVAEPTLRPRLLEPKSGQTVGRTLTASGVLPPQTPAFLGSTLIDADASGRFSMTLPAPTAPLLGLRWRCTDATCTLVRRIALAR